MIVSGGGVFKQFIMERLSQKPPCIVEKEKNYEALEALSFALLGYYTLQGIPTNVPNVTGASRSCILGNITNPIIRGEI
jgi:anhydro-N-acetylmuramic acid kinase